jgi:hypothetical protein
LEVLLQHFVDVVDDVGAIRYCHGSYLFLVA